MDRLALPPPALQLLEGSQTPDGRPVDVAVIEQLVGALRRG
jgi:hypothetical protein